MFELFFEIAPAIKELLKLKYELKENYFYELTSEQYQQLKSEGEDITETIYMLLPDNYQEQTIETLIVTQKQMDSLFKAQQLVEQYAKDSNKEFENHYDKLKYVSTMLPPIFLENTDFKRSHLKLLKERL